MLLYPKEGQREDDYSQEGFDNYKLENHLFATMEKDSKEYRNIERYFGLEIERGNEERRTKSEEGGDTYRPGLIWQQQ